MGPKHGRLTSAPSLRRCTFQPLSCPQSMPHPGLGMSDHQNRRVPCGQQRFEQRTQRQQYRTAKSHAQRNIDQNRDHSEGSTTVMETPNSFSARSESKTGRVTVVARRSIPAQ